MILKGITMCKKFISSILVLSLLNLIGCYSYSSLSQEELIVKLSFPDEPYRIVLNDGREIIYKPNEKVSLNEWKRIYKTILLRVDKPSDLIVGAGVIFDKKSKEQTIYWGVIKSEMIDSTKSTITNDGTYDLYWLNDGTRLTFKSSDYFNITTEDGTGYWVKGKNNYKDFRGKIELVDVKEIQQQTPLISSTGGTVILMIVGIGLAVLMGLAFSGLGGLSDMGK